VHKAGPPTSVKPGLQIFVHVDPLGVLAHVGDGDELGTFGPNVQGFGLQDNPVSHVPDEHKIVG
jgi:hypothetical protein